MNANEIIQAEFLPTRAKLLEIAAVLDRIDRARQSGDELSDLSDLQIKQLRDAMAILDREIDATRSSSRAETMQRLFSRSYDPEWKQKFEL